MQTFEEQKAFFARHWPQMKELVESGGAAALIHFIAQLPDPRERRVLYAFARQGLVFDEWHGKNLDAMIEVARAGIAECLRQAAVEETDELERRRKDSANVISYNLAADLADCWPATTVERTRAHFEAGLRAAEDCIRWREELAKPPGPRSMAWWAKGMHQLSLGRPEDARTSFERSRDHALEAAAGDATAFGVILAEGYAALAQLMTGDDTGHSRLEQALATFRSQCDDERRKSDAEFGIAQLDTVRERYLRR